MWHDNALDVLEHSSHGTTRPQRGVMQAQSEPREHGACQLGTSWQRDCRGCFALTAWQNCPDLDPMRFVATLGRGTWVPVAHVPELNAVTEGGGGME